MPFAGFKNFDECVNYQRKTKKKSLESAKKICGYLQKKTEGEISEEEYTHSLARLWFSEVLDNE